MEKQQKLAVLIDADNASAAVAEEMFAEIAKYGLASVKRIYGDWSSPTLGGWQKILLKYAIVPMQQFAYTKGKDATDMGLIIDAMDLLYSGTFDGFCLVSSDSDFTPLASRIRSAGLTVYGLGKKSTPEAFRNACDKFVYVENLQPTLNSVAQAAIAPPVLPETAAKAPSTRQPIEGGLKSLLFQALKNTAEDSSWSSVARIGSYLNQTHSDFDPRSYGYAKLSSMLKALEGVQHRYDDNNRSQMYFRKIPWSDFIPKIIEAHQKFEDKNGRADIATMEKYLQPRLDIAAYGFADLNELLEKMHRTKVENGRVSISLEEKKDEQ